MKIKILYLSLLLFLVGCSEKKTPIDFYYWKANVKIGETEIKYFDQLNSQNLFIRVFDVDNEGSGVKPKSKINPFDATLLNAKYTPVVFITNRTFLKSTEKELSELPQHVYKLISETMTSNKISNFDEIQIDCDWTNSTREAYFSFLKELKKISGRKIGSTIRLHQVKYKEKTGVPPIDKAYIMCYATSNPTDKTEANSILDISLLKDYLQNVNDYPVSFNLALPIYSWAIVTNHLGNIKLINGVSRKELDTDTFEKISQNTYKLKKDVFFHGLYLNRDFTLKIEEISPSLLKEAKQFFNQKVSKDYRLIYYHLDGQFLSLYSIDDLK